MDEKILWQKVIDQEKLLHFSSFDANDACALGLFMADEAKKAGINMLIDIRLNGFQRFRYAPSGITPENERWANRKINLVNLTQKSSLFTFCKLKVENLDLKRDRMLDPMDFAAVGGAFPIYVEGAGMIGVVAVSGLPHIQDHEFLVSCLAKYLGVTL